MKITFRAFHVFSLYKIMNRSVIAQGNQKVNRRSKLAVGLSEVNDQLVALSNIVTFIVIV